MPSRVRARWLPSQRTDVSRQRRPVQHEGLGERPDARARLAGHRDTDEHRKLRILKPGGLEVLVVDPGQDARRLPNAGAGAFLSDRPGRAGEVVHADVYIHRSDELRSTNKISANTPKSDEHPRRHIMKLDRSREDRRGSRGDTPLALHFADIGLLQYPESAKLRASRAHVLNGLLERYGQMNPFRFIVYSERAGYSLPPLTPRSPRRAEMSLFRSWLRLTGGGSCPGEVRKA
jgi:hypothetical protein